MIHGVAICPPAPFLVPGLAPALLARSGDLVAACVGAVGSLAGADTLVVLGVGPTGVRTLPPGSLVRPSVLGRSDLPVAADLRLPGGGPSDPAPPAAVGTVVGAQLLQAIDRPTYAIEVGPNDAAAAAAALDAISGAVGLLVMADGASCHGPGAPGARDDRSAGLDDSLADALGSGDAAVLGAWLAARAEVAMEVGVRSLPVLAALAATGFSASRSTVTYRGQPFGVGYFAATWSS